ncbi:recombinase family protein [Altererythrobacter sp. Root672]|uniref:recombinase family protein n=1 Tax=Altererythrobacter sp. Root672 TaxID=1736584 RepID=UPI0006F604F8|nr:recombinase family protein [Altererythrobacter sp. Root672]KRA79741.1 resolvase [Altererythrobacter sp. Root672]
MKQVRCAIYTRKSSDEGLEQDFNSLDAQREACVAYILSQASEGWKLVPERYDDGGLSGGTLQRPALQRLLADVKAGAVDIIVVYKVDRLTRSLLDFSKLVEALDAASTSFVSVTQSFNTTTSMGRLTLNMLLSFAQFEREVTAERIRDKIAASKAKGMWMGGTPPLGYRPEGRSLAIVEEHAALIRDIFARYRRLGNVRHVAEELASEGIITPRRVNGKGRAYGGCLFTRGQLYTILRNPIYAGDIPHKGKVYPGNHPPIIERDEWEGVQFKLSDNVKGRRTAREANASLLSGLLFDAEGQPLIPVHTAKGSQRYRYYVSKAQHHRMEPSLAPALRLPAPEIEKVVCEELNRLLEDPLALARRVGVEIEPRAVEIILQRAASLRADLAKAKHPTIKQLLNRIVIRPDRITLTLSHDWLAGVPGYRDASGPRQATHEIMARLTRTGRVVRLVDESGASKGDVPPDESLIRLVVTARRWWAELSKGELDINALSAREKVSASYMTRVVRLAFLAPGVTEAVLDGRTKAGLSGKELLQRTGISWSWEEQTARFLPGVRE